MTSTMIAALALLTATSPALAGPDLATTLSLPTGTLVYDDATYGVTVTNVGNRTANSASLEIQLPETNTSPTVHVMGEVGVISSSCTQSGTRLLCSLGRIRKGQSASVSFDLALPWSAAPLEIEAVASTSGDGNPGNDGDADAADLAYVDLVIAGPAAATNRHCTGTGLTAFYECSLYPSSITAHDTVFEADGSISFPLYPDYSGSWVQLSDDHLWFEYTYLGDVVAEFEGNGVDASCFEGLTTFPGSGWVSPYEVCLD